MKKVKLCVISSSTEFSGDQIEIGKFIRRLNNSFVDRDIYFNLRIYGDETDGQSESDVAFFLFFKKTDAEILAEFEAALEGFRKSGKPKIVTYFKQVDSEPQTEEIRRLIERLDREPDCYYSTYGHIDTLKLGILMQIKQLEPDGADIRLENGKAWLDGEALLSLDHAEMVSGYEDLQRLKTERAVLESRFFEAKTKYAENPDNGEAYKAFCEAAKLRSQAIQEIHDIETRLYHMIEGMYERTAGGKLSKRQVEGHRLMERGRFREAQAVLDFDGIVSESRHDEALADKMDKRAQVHVNEQLQLVDVNMTLGDWDSVDACYREAVRLEKRHNLPKKAMLAYIEFQYRQGKHDESIKTAETLLEYYRSPNDSTPDEEKGFFYNLLGIIYRDANRLAEAEEVHKTGLEIRKKLAGCGNAEFDKDLSNSYNNLGVVFKDTQRMTEAEEMYKAALEIRIRIASRNPDAYGPYVAYSYHNLGELYGLIQRIPEAEEMIKSSQKTMEELVERNARAFEYIELFLSDSYSILGYLYLNTGRLAEAEEIHRSALKIREKLVAENPDANETFLVDSYNNLGDVYIEAGRMTEAEKMLDAAVKIGKRLAAQSPGAFESDLARGYNSLGLLYYKTGRIAEAERMLKSAADIRIRYASGIDDVEPRLAKNYRDLGCLYSAEKRMTEAEDALRKAFEIQAELARSSPASVEPDFADTNYSIGELYRELGRTEEAEYAFNSALRLYDKYSGTNPRCEQKAAAARKELAALHKTHPAGDVQPNAMSLFTPEEREIALLLTEGLTQRDIARKLKLTTADVSRRVSAIRGKVAGAGSSDPSLAAIVYAFKLSGRESDILSCISRGMINADIAAELFITEETVRVHTHTLMKKLPVTNRQEVAAWVGAYRDSIE